jgi:hypothetical protein
MLTSGRMLRLLRTCCQALCLVPCLALLVTACTTKFDAELLNAAGSSAVTGDCASSNEGDACPGGICRERSCCAGCWDGQSCRAGNEDSACGAAGADCSECAGSLPACGKGACLAKRSVISVAASALHTCVSDAGKTLWCWGDNSTAAAGGPNNDEPFVELPQAFATGSWIEVAAGGSERTHACAVHFGGSLWCWGANSRGQLGLDPAMLPTARGPALVDEGPWLKLAAGDQVSCGRVLHLFSGP